MSALRFRATAQGSLGQCLHRCTSSRDSSARLALRRNVAVSVCLSGHTAITTQYRAQFAQVPGKRSQEAFLSQYNPLEVLALDESCSVAEIDDAFKRMSAKYGPNGSNPDAKLMERIFRAHEILKDPGSPYYLRAHSSESDRQRLQFELLPKSKRTFIQVQVGMLMLFVAGLALLVISLTFRPIKRTLRAATR